MSLDQDYINETCNSFTNFVRELSNNLDIKYIFHRRGQRDDAIELEKSFFNDHIAGRNALILLREEQNTQNSRFYGLSVETTYSMMGLKENKSILGVITINLDNHESTESVLHEVYHLGWMAIDTTRLLEHPKYKNALKSGTLSPTRNALNTAKSCLQADIFSVLILSSQGFDRMIKDVADKRGMDAMSPNIKASPWNYPYPIAFETTKQAWNDLIDINSREYHFIKTPLEFANSITNAIPDENYQQWWDFCKPAQEMAWHNDTPEHILSAAEHTSDDPIIKVTANLLKKCTDINTSEELIRRTSFNSFASNEQNEENHETNIEETFEATLQEGINTGSNKPFINEANRQNKGLTEGHVFGWCASALHAAANSFDISKSKSGDEQERLIKLGFEGAKKEIKYDSLLTLGEKIINYKKQGKIITIENISTLAKSQKNTTFITDSVAKTINDPAYKKELAATQDMNNIYTIKRDSPKQQAQPSTPDVAPRAAPNISSGMGGGGMMGGTSAPVTDNQQSTEDEKAE